MEEDESEKMPEEDLNWEDFMNVVTTYSCKFCTFTCTVPAQMGQHVKTHMAKRTPPAPSLVTSQGQNVQKLTPSDSNTLVTSVGTISSAECQPIGSSSSQEVSLCFVGQSEAADGMAILSGVAVDPCNGTIVSGRAEPIATIPCSVSVVNPNQDKEQEESMEAVAQSAVDAAAAIAEGRTGDESTGHVIIVEPLEDEEPPADTSTVATVPIVHSMSTTEQSNTVIAISSAAPQPVSVPSLSIPTIDISGVYNPAPQQYSVVAENPLSSVPVPSAPVPVASQMTKELFLCGQCSLGFASIDECRDHMIQSHSLILPVGEEAETDGVNQVSVGTQVAQRKKPGRKRKSELPPPVPKSKDPDEDDEDWEPGVDISNSRETRKKRKIRPPRALKEDYYLGKKKKKKRERRTYKESFNLKCKLFGCQAKFRDQAALDLHVKCHNDEDFCFSCIECKEQFEVWKLLRIHLWKKHKIDCDLFQCETCGTKTDTFHKLSIHKEIHSDNRPYTCDICGKGFKQFSQMRNHQVIHTEHRVKESERWYSAKPCEVCKRTFANRKCLKKHMQAVHNKVKPYTCHHCGHTAARKAMLDLHIRIHTGEKPFKCDVCPYSSGDHNSLRRHKMRHTGQKQYKCQYCAYSCIQSISLKTHMKNKHSGLEGIYACDTCIFRTVNKSSYEQHLRDHKNGLVPDVKPAMKPIAPETVQPEEQTQTQDSMAVQMQVQTMASGEAQISEEDLARLSSCEGLVSGDMSAASLIYSALSAISQNPQHTTQSAHILGGVQTLIKSSSTEQGVTTHTITFYVPSGGAPQDGSVAVAGTMETEQVYFEQPVEVIEALQRASGQQGDQNIVTGDQSGVAPTVIAMEATEAELQDLNINLVPVSAGQGTLVVQQEPEHES